MLLGHAASAKAQVEEASPSFRSQLAAELDSTHQEGETDAEVHSKSRLTVLLWRAMSSVGKGSQRL
jgi:hypothetical protein